MDAHQTVNGWLGKINPADSGLVLDGHGQCRLVTQEGESCIISVPKASSTQFRLSLRVMPLPPQCGTHVHEELLKLNMPCQLTRGGSLSLDPLSRNIMLNYVREIAITDMKTFCAILENFLNAAEEIKQRIHALLQLPAPEKARLHKTASALLSKVSPSFSVNT